MQTKTIGYQKWQEWEKIKARYDYCCTICRASEKDLAQKWRKTNFTKLTEDHIAPIAKGGTNYIKNIQPLCISCNAKKKDRKN